MRLALFAPAADLSDALGDAGAEVLSAPRPLTTAARLVLGAAPLDAWIVRRREELDALAAEPADFGSAPRPLLLCSGIALAERARSLGWARAEVFAPGDPVDAISRALRSSAADRI